MWVASVVNDLLPYQTSWVNPFNSGAPYPLVVADHQLDRDAVTVYCDHSAFVRWLFGKDSGEASVKVTHGFLTRWFAKVP